MQRRRTIAASPERNAAEAWRVIRELVGDTLERCSSIDRAEVDAELEALGQLARMLISAGHLEKHPLVLVAGEVWLEIVTVSGSAALALEENLNPVPGAAAATDWRLHVPQVEPTAKLARTTVKGHQHLSAHEPSELTESSATSAARVDLDALKRWARERA